MQTIIRTRAHDLGKLHDELLAAIPALHAAPTGPGGRLQAAMLLSDDGERITLQVPDGVSEAAIEAVLAAHDPTPRPDPPNPRAGRIAALRGAGTQAEKIAAMMALVLSLAGDEG